MAKGQVRSNREKRKPKQVKTAEKAPIAFGAKVDEIKNRDAVSRKGKS